MRHTLCVFTLLVVLGAGCLPAGRQAPTTQAPAPDATPGINEENCLKSGGAVIEGECECSENHAPDPAGFCLDAEGRPGGEMAPK